MYDIAIVGMGPAGSTLARLLSRDLRVLVIDRKAEGNAPGFQKPCGGLLSGDAQKALSKFNLTLPKSVLSDPQIFAVRTIDLRQRLLRHYQRFYINMDRGHFDQWLIRLIPDCVERVFSAEVRQITRRDGGFDIVFLQNGQARSVRAKYVVGADGANSIVRRSLFPKRRIRNYVAIQQWFSDSSPRPLYSCFFDRELTDCYAWSVSKDGQIILGGAFPPQNCRARFEALKHKLSAYGYQLDQPTKTEACQVLRPRGVFSFETGARGAFLIGEAAGLISPSSLEGISYALESGALLAGVLNRGRGISSAHRAYSRLTRAMRLKLLVKNLKSPFLYVPFLRMLVMKSGLRSIRMEPAPGDPLVLRERGG